jgi:hypothetical protein
MLATATRASVQCAAHGAHARSRQPPPARQPEDSFHVGDLESTDLPLIPVGLAGYRLSRLPAYDLSDLIDDHTDLSPKLGT